MSKKTVHTNIKLKKVVVATLNINGLPSFRHDARTKALLLPHQIRHRELCRYLEASDIDVINFQEIVTYRNYWLLKACLPSFGYVSFEPSLLGPKGALVTFSRLPMEKVSYGSYREVVKLVEASVLPRLSMTKMKMKGILVSQLKNVPLTVINTHPLANDDWDWSDNNRFYALHKAQLSKLASLIQNLRAANKNAIILGSDLNIAKDSSLFRDFLSKCELHDIFQGDTHPTFHSEFVEPGKLARCIDYLLTSNGVVMETSHRIFEGRVSVRGYGDIYITDHEGLCATLKV
jgi:exonuclease III